ncbi:MAG TPA: hypothetical protein VKZ50_00655 [bacterium]|nr:hypothetical protein [bacterium]
MRSPDASAASQPTTEADVVIAGASFAGLAVARELPGRTVLIDHQAVGEGQTSACGTPISVLASIGASSAVQESHDDLVIHTPGRTVRWPLPEPFCTFDYRACCVAVFRGADAPIIRAFVHGRAESLVRTTAGDVSGRVLVDATGWRAALSGGTRRPGHPGGYVGFGLEATVPVAFDTGLHFYFWPDILPDGYLWVFPAGTTSRVGLISYRARTQVGPALDVFLCRLGLPSGPRHGGFLGGGFRPPVVDGVFVVGDAAGQCLPFTGEGIRLAVRAGGVAGRLIDQALAGRISLDVARARYRAFALRARRSYRILEWGTKASLVLPASALGAVAGWAARPGPLRILLGHYLKIFAPGAASV